jgi:hypothetical protein
MVLVIFAFGIINPIATAYANTSIQSYKSLLALTDKKYEYVIGFSESIALVANEGKSELLYGYVNSNGIDISPCKYCEGYLFSDGMARVGIKNKSGIVNFGYINLSGKEVIECKYESASDFVNGLAVVMNSKGQYALINKRGSMVVKFGKYDYIDQNTLPGKLIAVIKDGDHTVGYRLYYGFVDRKGREVVKPKYEDIYKGSFSDGLICVKNNNKFGYINISGKEVVPVKYESISKDLFADGYSVVKLKGKYGAVDYKGKVVLKPQYDSLEILDQDYAIYNVGYREKEVKKNFIKITPGVWGLMDIKGNIVIEPKYDRIGRFSDGLACVNIGGSFPSSTSGNGSTSLVIFSGGAWGYINNQGEEVVPLQYDEAGYFSEGLALVKKNSKYGFINTKGEEVIPLIYDNAYDFTDGLAQVSIGDKSGYIDKTGKEVVKIKYDEVSGFSMGFASVKLKNKWGFVNTRGEVAIPIQYDDSKSGGNYWFFESPFSAAVMKGKYITINTYGENLSKLGEISSLIKTTNGCYAFSIKFNGRDRYGYFDKKGKLLLNPNYEYASDIVDGIAFVKIDGRLLFFKASVDGMKEVEEYYKTVK